jgi:hypothetical protein
MPTTDTLSNLTGRPLPASATAGPMRVSPWGGVLVEQDDRTLYVGLTLEQMQPAAED